MKAETEYQKEFLNRLKTICLNHIPCFIQRIESNMTAQGIPDVFVLINRNPIWIEFKSKEGSLSSMQIQWMERYEEASGCVYVIYEGQDIDLLVDTIISDAVEEKTL